MFQRCFAWHEPRAGWPKVAPTDSGTLSKTKRAEAPERYFHPELEAAWPRRALAAALHLERSYLANRNVAARSGA